MKNKAIKTTKSVNKFMNQIFKTAVLLSALGGSVALVYLAHKCVEPQSLKIAVASPAAVLMVWVLVELVRLNGRE
jgi:hypothetical protein